MAEPSPDTVFAKTEKGTEEIRSRTVKLPREAGLVFLSIDGETRVADLLPRSGMAAPDFYRTLEALVAEGYIESAASRPAGAAPPDGDRASQREPYRMPTVETARAAPRLWSAPETNKFPEIDVAARASELKARVEADRRAREEADRKARESLRPDVPVAPADATETHPPQNVREGAERNDKGAPGATVPRAQSEQAGAAGSVPSDVARAADRIRAKNQSDSSAAAGSLPKAGPAAGLADARAGQSGPLRVEGNEPSREKLHADRAAYDLLAEAAQARRAAVAAMRAQSHAEAARDFAGYSVRDRRTKRRARWGLAAFVLFVVLPAIGVLLLQFMPLTRYVPEVEQALSAHLNQPVRLRSVRYVLLPTPRFILQGVAIGNDAGFRTDRVEAHVSPLALLTRPTQFGAVEVQDAIVAPAMLATMPSWLAARGTPDVRISHLQITNLRIDAPAAKIAPFDGEVSFEQNGSVEAVVLANDHLKIRLSPAAKGAVLKLDATSWTIPFGPPVQFSYFTAAGRLTDREVVIDEFTGRVAGGYLQANGTLRWPGPLVAHGGFALQNVRLEELLPALTRHVSGKGVLEAHGRYEMQAENAEALLESTRLDAEFRVSRGEIENLDLLRGFHAPGASSSRGGRTPFERLTGTFHLSPKGYQYRQVRLTSGPFNAIGAFEVAPGGKLSGRVHAELVVGTHVAARSAFEVGGTVSDPVLRR